VVAERLSGGPWVPKYGLAADVQREMAVRGDAMDHVESLQAMVERRLISSLVRVVNATTTEEVRQRRLSALRDLVRHADPSLDADLLDAATRSFLQRAGLWIWADADTNTEPDSQATAPTGDDRAEDEQDDEMDGRHVDDVMVQSAPRRRTPRLRDECPCEAKRIDLRGLRSGARA
jgi:hypothetical protein